MALVEISLRSPWLLAVGDHVDDARVQQRLAPDVQGGRLHAGRHLVHDGEEVPVQ